VCHRYAPREDLLETVLRPTLRLPEDRVAAILILAEQRLQHDVVWSVVFFESWRTLEMIAPARWLSASMFLRISSRSFRLRGLECSSLMAVLALSAIVAKGVLSSWARLAVTASTLKSRLMRSRRCKMIALVRPEWRNTVSMSKTVSNATSDQNEATSRVPADGKS